MKTRVYSWRLAESLKSDLEREARLRSLSVSSLLDLAVTEWLNKSALRAGDRGRQAKLHASVAPCLGAFAGGSPRRSESVRALVRQRINRRQDVR